MSNIKVIYWVHSGGADPATGEPSLASKWRLEMLTQIESVLPPDSNKGGDGERLIVFSGEDTRKSGAYIQALQLEKHWRFHQTGIPPWLKETEVQPLGMGMMAAFERIRADYPTVEVVYFINDQGHLDRYEWKFAKIDGSFTAKIRRITVPVFGKTEYLDKYPLPYIAAYNFLAWGREVWRIGPFQLLLFGVDRKFNKPTRNPLKRMMLWCVNKWLRADLR